MSRSYVVSKGAAADLREIVRYTVKQWGEAQCRTYVAELEKATEAVAKGEGVFKGMSRWVTGYISVSYAVGQGYILNSQEISIYSAPSGLGVPGRRRGLGGYIEAFRFYGAG